MATKKASKAAAREPVYKKTKSGRMVRYIKDGQRIRVFVKRFDPFTGEAVKDDEQYSVDIATLTQQRDAHLAEAARLQEEIDEAGHAEEPEPTEGEPSEPANP
jgi:hypothetical protein